jgi:cleavage stimulation factor subunit 2
MELTGTNFCSKPSGQQQNQQKHDIFVGNLAFSTTEDQLHQAFSEIGRVIKVRLVTDMETGKPRGFAFIEFEDPQAALSAIRNMNDYELNGRRVRVNFSNSSHLEALAGKLGMDLSQQTQRPSSSSNTNQQSGSGTNAVSDALKSMSKGEMYDVVAKFKEIADRDPDEARRILSGHPQLPEAMLFLMSKLDMVQTSIPTEGGGSALSAAVPNAPIPMQTTSSRAADPRARALDPRAAASSSGPIDPRSSAAPAPPPPRADPRARVDPRASRGAPPPPMMPPQQPQYGVPPPQPGLPPMQPPPAPGLANLDPSLVQQVMSLTPQQISQLPPNKQQSILALRQQISGAGM